MLSYKLSYATPVPVAKGLRFFWGRGMVTEMLTRDMRSKPLCRLPGRPVAPDDGRRLMRVEANVSCGFPSPATDYAGTDFNLNDFFVRNAAATYVVEAAGDAMLDAGIVPGDILIVDRSRDARNGDIVLAFCDGVFTVRRFVKDADGTLKLLADNAAAGYPPIVPTPESECLIEGVVTGLGRRFV